MKVVKTLANNNEKIPEKWIKLLVALQSQTKFQQGK